MALGGNKFSKLLNTNSIEVEDGSFASRLHEGSDAFGTKSVIGKGIAHEKTTTEKGETSILIQLSEVTPRFANKYIQDPSTLNALCVSIRNQGLIQPIKVINISSMINISEGDEKQHYERKKEQGSKYVIIAGHRRFEAFVNNFLDDYVEGWRNKELSGLEYFDKNIDGVISKAINCIKKYNATKTGIEFVAVSDELKEEYSKLKHFFIPSFVSNEISEEDETRIYNDTNLTQRAVSSFEIVANVYDEINKLSEDEKDKFIKDQCKNTRSSINKAIVIYIDEKYGVKVPVDTVTRTLKIVTTFDDELLQAIYDGKMSFRVARDIVPYYSLLSKEYSEEFNAFKEKCISGKCTTKDIKELMKLCETKKEPVNKKPKIEKRDILAKLKQVKMGKLDIDKLVEYIKENYS